MRNTQAALKWLLILVLLLLFMLAALWGVSRMLYPSEAQRQAIEELLAWPEFEGENAYALLWTLDRDVPDGELQAVLDEDVREWAESLQSGTKREDSALRYPWSSAIDYPDLGVSDDDRPLFCKGLEPGPGCLQRVSNDLGQYINLVEKYAPLLDRVQGLQRFAYVRTAFPYSVLSPWPDYSSAGYLRTRHAVQFAEGRHREALAAVCLDITTWRRLSVQSDSLITRMVGIAYSSRDNGRLLADMLAEMPTGEPLPEACEEALAPTVPTELSICNAMRGEFAFSDYHYREGDLVEGAGTLDKVVTYLLLDPEASTGLRAEQFVPACRQDGHPGSALEPSLLAKPLHDTLWRFECISNLVGCGLERLASPAYGDYELRVQDHGARLRALATLAWMRENAGQGRSPETLLVERPAALVGPSDDLAIGPDGKTLQLALRWKGRGESWSIPLPPALQAQAPGENNR